MAVIPATGRDARSPNIQKIDLDVSDGRDNDPIKMHGNIIRVWDASTAGVLCDLRLRKSEFEDPIPFGKGAAIVGFEFDKIWLDHDQKSEHIFVYHTKVPGIDYKDITPAEKVQTFNREKPSTYDTDVTTAAANDTTQIIGSNTDRQRVIFENLDGSNEVWLLHDGTKQNQQGERLGPEEQSKPYRTTSAIHAFNPNGSSVDVTYREEAD